MNFKSEVKDRGARWWERRWWVWWGDMRKMRWTRRTVNTMRLTEWRRELIPQVRWCIGRVWSAVHQNRSWYRNRSTSGSDETTSASSIRRRLDSTQDAETGTQSRDEHRTELQRQFYTHTHILYGCRLIDLFYG